MAEKPYTAQCPNCNAEIDLTQEDMDMAGGDIICGNCDQQFHSPDYLLKGFYSAERSGSQLVEKKAQIHQEPKYETETETEPEVEDMTPQAPQNYEDPIQPEFELLSRYRHHKRMKLFWGAFNSAAVVILAAGFLVQLAMVNVNSWVTTENFRPFYAFTCSLDFFKCNLPQFYEPKDIKVENFQTTLQGNSVYNLQATLTNYGEASREFPWLKVTLSSNNGAAIAEGRFSPEQYLTTPNKPTVMPPAQSFPVSLKIVSPSSQVARYEITPLAGN